MTEASAKPMITFVDEASARALVDLVGIADAQVVKRNNFNGDQATWIVLANIALSALPHIIAYLKERRDCGKVKKIVFTAQGGEKYEIENPTPEQLEDFHAQIKKTLS